MCIKWCCSHIAVCKEVMWLERVKNAEKISVYTVYTRSRASEQANKHTEHQNEGVRKRAKHDRPFRSLTTNAHKMSLIIFMIVSNEQTQRLNDVILRHIVDDIYIGVDRTRFQC